MSNENRQSRRRLYGFIIFSLIEEVIIGFIAFMLLLVFLPQLLIPGMIVIAIGLVIFTVVKIYSYRSSASIPVYDLIIGQEGIALVDFQKINANIWEGKVLVKGEYWKARAEEAISQNSQVWVNGIDGFTLEVSLTQRKSL